MTEKPSRSSTRGLGIDCWPVRSSSDLSHSSCFCLSTINRVPGERVGAPRAGLRATLAYFIPFKCVWELGSLLCLNYPLPLSFCLFRHKVLLHCCLWVSSQIRSCCNCRAHTMGTFYRAAGISVHLFKCKLRKTRVRVITVA